MLKLESKKFLLPVRYEYYEISVLDVPEAPVFTCCLNANIFENDTFVIQLSAYDPEGENITYVVYGGAHEDFFHMDSQSGLLSLTDPINYEVGPTTLFVDVAAFDGYSTTIQTVTVDIVNIHEAPIITSPTSFRYYEYSTDPVLTVTAESDTATTIVTALKT